MKSSNISVWVDWLNTHVRSTRVEVFLNSRFYLFDFAPGEGGVDELVRTLADVFFAEAHPEPIVSVIR